VLPSRPQKSGDLVTALPWTVASRWRLRHRLEKRLQIGRELDSFAGLFDSEPGGVSQQDCGGPRHRRGVVGAEPFGAVHAPGRKAAFLVLLALAPHAVLALHTLIANRVILMANLTIRNVDEALKALLRVRAASHGHSMEEEVRHILRAALNEPSVAHPDLAQRIRRRFASLGDVQLPLPRREPVREPPLVDEPSRPGTRSSGNTRSKGSRHRA